uniref:Uncharacterized protein n=1 Tax=Romanomermis culicivorax TaxID=13658 RepID=A0A915IIJ5_ROMCU
MCNQSIKAFSIIFPRGLYSANGRFPARIVFQNNPDFSILSRLVAGFDGHQTTQYSHDLL